MLTYRNEFSQAGCGYGFMVALGIEGELTLLHTELSEKNYDIIYNDNAPRSPEKITFDHFPMKSEICSVCSGENHTLLLDASKNVYAFGKNTLKQLGVPSPKYSKTPLRVLGLPPIDFIAAGGSFNMAIDENGKLWGWGLNSLNQLGGDSENRKPRMIPNIPQVQQVACGGNFTIATTVDGKYLGWGHNAVGQIGTPMTNELREMLVPDDIVKISCGFFHCMFLTSAGNVYAQGSCEKRQCGPDTSEKYQNTLILLSGLPEIRSIKCGSKVSYCIDTFGELWKIGGDDSDGTPFKVPGLPPIQSIESNYSTIAKDSETGAVWVWGSTTTSIQKYPDSSIMRMAIPFRQKSARK